MDVCWGLVVVVIVVVIASVVVVNYCYFVSYIIYIDFNNIYSISFKTATIIIIIIKTIIINNNNNNNNNREIDSKLESADSDFWVYNISFLELDLCTIIVVVSVVVAIIIISDILCC